jgi:hypothetical protein
MELILPSQANPFFQPLKVWHYALFCVEMLPPEIVKAEPTYIIHHNGNYFSGTISLVA